MSKVIELNTENFEEKVINSKVPVLVDFFAPWCGPCQMMHPVLDELAEAIGDKAVIAKVNTDVPENDVLSGKYQIRSIPNMKLFKGGEIVNEFIGVKSLEELESAIEEIA